MNLSPFATGLSSPVLFGRCDTSLGLSARAQPHARREAREHARKEPDTKAGNKQALDDIAEAIKLKAALRLVDAAIAAHPET